jgi:exodeoxyribonuclease-1
MARRYPPFEPAQVVEQRMYEGFPICADENPLQTFHSADWAERAEIAETFEDDRYRELARRLVFLNSPDVLTDPRRAQLQAWLENRLHGRDGVQAGRTIADALAELDNDSPTDQPLEAAAIRTWLQGLDS